jgi:hypothetical protein
VVEVPPALIEIHPQWRGHSYFVVHDDVVIVDRDHKIVATVPAGSSSAQMDGGKESVTFSEEEIRQVQVILKQKGFVVEVDGELGPQTKKALIEFQRQQGIQASGRIDSRTVTALGLSDKLGGQDREGASQPSTAGQRDRMQQSTGDRDRGTAQQDERDGSRPSTTGQSGDRMPASRDRESGKQESQGASQPSTTGQGGDRMQQAPQDGAAGRDRMQGDQAK